MQTENIPRNNKIPGRATQVLPPNLREFLLIDWNQTNLVFLYTILVLPESQNTEEKANKSLLLRTETTPNFVFLQILNANTKSTMMKINHCKMKEQKKIFKYKKQ